jgi:predicted SAM-dependent methyltransferase
MTTSAMTPTAAAPETTPTPPTPAPTRTGIRRLNWGCGGHTLPGWINSDQKDGPGIDLSCDIARGLPLETDSIDYAVSIHALPEVPYDAIVPVLSELRRVIKPGGILRLCLPDLIKGIRAYERGDRDYFLIPDEDAKSLGAKLITQLVWYGYSRTLFTSEFIEEMLLKAGFSRVQHCVYRQTSGADPEIVDLDNREPESLYVEAYK